MAKLRTKIEVPRLRFRSGASQVERMDTEVAGISTSHRCSCLRRAFMKKEPVRGGVAVASSG